MDVSHPRFAVSHRHLLLFATIIVAAGIVLLLFEWQNSVASSQRRLTASNAQRTTLQLLVNVLSLHAAELAGRSESVNALAPRIEAELEQLRPGDGEVAEFRRLLRAKLNDTRFGHISADEEARFDRIRLLGQSISDRYFAVRNAEATHQEWALLWNHIILVAVSLGVLALLLTATSRIERLLEHLAHERDRYRLLADHLDRVREDERALLSRELHDDVGQALTGLKLAISSIPRVSLDAESQHILERSTHAIDETIQKTRNVCSMLRPPMLDQLGLLASIEWLVRDFREKTRIDCNFRSAAEEPAHFDEECRLGVFRIVQEALTNAARHAKPEAIHVAAYEQVGSLILEVQDNGTGFRVESIEMPRTLGIAGMQERARSIGATLEIESEPGQGTSVRLRVPVQAEVPA